MNTRPFILCADDFALSESSSQGIVQLLQQSRLSAVSAVVNTTLWPTHNPLLHPFRGKVDLGLHFNLTEGTWLSASPTITNLGLKSLILKTYTGRLSQACIAAELSAQVEAFTTAMGQAPNFIDGHQHIQQFPQVRQAILAWFHAKGQALKPYFRCSYLDHVSGSAYLKRWIINRLGAKTLRKQLAGYDISYNHEFSGVYDFSPHANYRRLFCQFLQEIKQRGLIMCHPAQGLDPNDPHAQARQNEFNYFMSADFVTDCRNAGLHMSRGHFLSSL